MLVHRTTFSAGTAIVFPVIHEAPYRATEEERARPTTILSGPSG